MKSSIDSIIYRATKKLGISYGLIYTSYDGLFERMMSNINVTMYNVIGDGSYNNPSNDWPESYNELKNGYHITNRLDIDYYFCNSRIFCDKANGLSGLIHVPMVIIDHDMPVLGSGKESKDYINNEFSKRVPAFVSTSQVVSDEWEYVDTINNEVIPYGFHKRKPVEKDVDVMVVGEFGEDTDAFVSIVNSCHHDVVCIGYNNGLTQEYKTYDELESLLDRAKIVVVNVTENRAPILAMLAMSCGCVVLANETRWTLSFMNKEHLYGSIEDMKEKLKVLSKGNVEKESLDNVNIIQDLYSMDKFIENWNDLLKKLETGTYKYASSDNSQ